MQHASQMAGLRWKASGAEAAVSFYTPTEPHRMHEHDAAHISFVLSGSIQESTTRGATEANAGALRARPEGFRHAVSFGPRGALILTLPAPPHSPDLSGMEAAWHAVRGPGAWREVLRNLFAGVACDVQTASSELVALASPAASNGAPSWLNAARERIMDSPADARVEALAEEAGVHRVHFARMFIARFGVPPSVMRRRAMLEHALAAILNNQRSLAEAAASAGFSDQAHMSRAFSEFLNVAPSRLRALLR